MKKSVGNARKSIGLSLILEVLHSSNLDVRDTSRWFSFVTDRNERSSEFQQGVNNKKFSNKGTTVKAR